MLYSGGLGVEKNKNAARKWFNEAYEVFMKDSEIDLEDDGDMIGLGMFYLMKYVSDIDSKESGENAFKWFKKAAEIGGLSTSGEDAYYAKFLTGICYVAEIGTAPNYEKALELFNEVAGDYIEIPLYRINLKENISERTGMQIPNDHKYKKNAKFMIGYCYAEGKGVPQDYQKAFEYFMEAADAGFTEAMANVGAYYWQGKGVEKDYDQAFYWCLKAAESGNVTAMNTVGKIYYLDTGSHKDYERAVFWFEKAANSGNVDAMKNLAIMYKNGEGVPKDEKKSKEWQQKYEKFQNAFKPIKI